MCRRFHKPYPPRPNIGERHGRAKLTEADVRAIRSRHVWLCGKNGVTALAKEYGVAKHTIQLIVQRKTWKHVTDQPERLAA